MEKLLNIHAESNLKNGFRPYRSIVRSVLIGIGLFALLVFTMPRLARATVVNSATETDFFVCTLREAIKRHDLAGCYNPPPFGTYDNQPHSDTIDFAPNIANVFLNSPLPAITPPSCGGSETLIDLPRTTGSRCTGPISR